jgi:hypothetical protein
MINKITMLSVSHINFGNGLTFLWNSVQTLCYWRQHQTLLFNLIDSIPLCGLTIYLLLIPRQNKTLLTYNKALRKVKNIRQHVSVRWDDHQALGNVQS